MRYGHVSLLVLLLAAASAGAHSRQAVVRPDLADRLARLDALFETGGPVDTDTNPVQTVRNFMRSRMKQDSFYAAIIPRLFEAAYSSPGIRNHAVMPTPLKSAPLAGGGTFYFLDTPCSATDLEDVNPWWDLQSTVKVCRDSHRPEILSDNSLPELKRFCETPFATRGLPPEKRVCGCGRYLINCTQSAEQGAQLETAARDEPIRTMQYVITHHQPFSQALLMNGSVRSDLADFLYARNGYFKTGKLAFQRPDPMGPPTLRPRPKEFTGGVLTTWFYRTLDPGPRFIVARMWEAFLGVPLASREVHASSMFELEGAHLRDLGQMALAEKTGCKECHAKLEYGMRAFRQFLPLRIGVRSGTVSDPELTTRLYVIDSQDLRTEGNANPLWAGQALVNQPEFKATMVKRVEALVYGGYQVPKKIHDALALDFARDEDLGRLIENTAVAWVFGSSEPASM